MMRLDVSKQAAQWFIEELHLNKGDSIQFFGKVYGGQGGFSFALLKQEATRPLISVNVEGINFYIEKNDEWFFAGMDLRVDYDEKLGEPSYHYEVKE